MNPLRYSPYEEDLIRPLSWSFGLHILALVLIVFRSAWIHQDELNLQQVIRVDLVGLPDKIQNKNLDVVKNESIPPKAPLIQPKENVVDPQPSSPSLPKEKTTESSKIRLEKSVQQKKMEHEKILQTLRQIKQEVQESKNSQPVTTARSLKGQNVRVGNSLTGLEQLEFDRYVSSLEAKVKQNWDLPRWLSESQLRAQVLVLIDSVGHILRRQIIQSSGNETFDHQVLAAIDKSAPFDEPPEKLKDVLAFKGVLFNFPN